MVTGEPSPVDGPHTRLLRSGLLAETLAARGHDVTWFNGTFNHNTKTERFAESTVLPAEAGITKAFLYGRPYAGNVSVARILSHHDTASAFLKLARGLPRPDVIQCSYPPIELAGAVAQFARAEGIPYIIDYRDLWPDIIADVAPALLRPLARLAMLPWYLSARRTAKHAAGLVGITRPFLDWACGFAGRKADGRDRVLHLANAASGVDADAFARAENYWDECGVKRDGFTLVFSGSLSHRMDLETVIDGARLLPSDIRIVICGKGDAEDALKARAQGCPNVIFAGWRNQAELQALMARSAGGLLPYKSTRDFAWSFPNKVGEYFSAGLPILTCLQGEISGLIERTGCGVVYREGDARSFADAAIAFRDCDRTAMREAAGRVYAAQFDPRKIYAGYADYLESFPR